MNSDELIKRLLQIELFSLEYFTWEDVSSSVVAMSYY